MGVAGGAGGCVDTDIAASSAWLAVVARIKEVAWGAGLAGSQDQTGETPSLAGTWSAEPSAVDRKRDVAHAVIA